MFTDRLEDHGIDISMDGRGHVMDNIFIERLWRTVKDEDVPEAMAHLKIYFGFDNHEHPHQALGYLTPAAIYSKLGRKPYEQKFPACWESDRVSNVVYKRSWHELFLDRSRIWTKKEKEPERKKSSEGEACGNCRSRGNR